MILTLLESINYDSMSMSHAWSSVMTHDDYTPMVGPSYGLAWHEKQNFLAKYLLLLLID